jgi:hypothetical protein
VAQCIELSILPCAYQLQWNRDLDGDPFVFVGRGTKFLAMERASYLATSNNAYNTNELLLHICSFRDQVLVDVIDS